MGDFGVEKECIEEMNIRSTPSRKGEKGMSILKDCIIKFYTKGAGKSAETPITITVRDEKEVVAAFTRDDFGPFDEHSESGPFDLSIINPSEKADLRRGSIAIRMEPKPQDIWKFNFLLF